MRVQLVQLIQFVSITRIAPVRKQSILPGWFRQPVCPGFSGGPRGFHARVGHFFVSGADPQVNELHPYFEILSATFPIPRDGGHEWEFFLKNTACIYLKRA